MFSDSGTVSYRAGRTVAASAPSDSVHRLRSSRVGNQPGADGEQNEVRLFFFRKNKQKGKNDKQVCVYIIKRQLLCPASLRGEGGVVWN